MLTIKLCLSPCCLQGAEEGSQGGSKAEDDLLGSLVQLGWHLVRFAAQLVSWASCHPRLCSPSLVYSASSADLYQQQPRTLICPLCPAVESSETPSPHLKLQGDLTRALFETRWQLPSSATRSPAFSQGPQAPPVPGPHCCL